MRELSELAAQLASLDPARVPADLRAAIEAENAAVRAAAAIAVTPNGRSRESLLPDAFRQKSAVDKYLHLVESR
jgi:hypothetical protein